MSISYQSKDDRVLSIALKVQELCVKLSDAVVSVDAAVATIDLGEEVEEVRVALHCDDADAVTYLITQSNISFPDEETIDDPNVPGGSRVSKGSRVALTLDAPLESADSIVLKYVLHE